MKNSDAFAQWYREGTYPAPILEWREAGVNTNMMTVNGFTSDTSFRAAECAVLDKMDVYGSKGNLNNLYYTKGYGLEMIVFGVLVDSKIFDNSLSASFIYKGLTQ